MLEPRSFKSALTASLPVWQFRARLDAFTLNPHSSEIAQAIAARIQISYNRAPHRRLLAVARTCMKPLLTPRTGLGLLLLFACTCMDDPQEGTPTSAGGTAPSSTGGATGSTASTAATASTGGSTGGSTHSNADTEPEDSTTHNAPGSTGEDAEEGSESSGTEPRRACDGEPLPQVMLAEVIRDLDAPIAIAFVPADPGYAYVALRAGRLLRVDLADPENGREELLNLDVSTDGECGLLSFAFHPDFDGSTEQRFYLSHTSQCGGDNSVVSEYLLDGTTATFSRDIFSVNQPATNHNGGHVVFGPDGYLYFGLGDGGGSNDEYGHGQNPETPLAAILRLDVDELGTPPPGNLTSESIGGGTVDPWIMHWGLRNPWRFAFDRGTGDLYIADVGQGAWEEIDFLPAGSAPANFGWPAFEGNVECPTCNDAELHPGATDVKPIHVYENPPGEGSSRSVTGGVVYRGSAIPELQGRYLYAEYAEGWIAALTWDGQDGSCDHGELITRQREGIVSFGEDTDGEVYVVHLTDGVVFRIDPS